MKKLANFAVAIVLAAACCGPKGPQDVLYLADEANLSEEQIKSLREIGVDVISSDTTVLTEDTFLPLLKNFGLLGEGTEEIEAVLRFTLPDTTPRVDLLLPCCSSCGKGAFYKDLIAFRHAHSALADGEYMDVDDQWVPNDVLAYTRSNGKETIMVLVNFSDQYTETALPDAEKWSDAFSAEVFDEELNCPVIAPWGWRILVRK